VREHGGFIQFDIYDQNVANREISVSTKENATAREVVESVVAAAGCQYCYGNYGAFNDSMGAVQILEKDKKSELKNDFILRIRDSGIITSRNGVWTVEKINMKDISDAPPK
jgi:hypothetical protein